MVYEIGISKEKIREGIEVALNSSTKHLDGAEVLIDRNLLDDAVALTEFAVEEFGRGVYLRDRLRKDLETIEKALETSHRLKFDNAFSVLPEELKVIWEELGYFPEGYWPTGYWPRGYWGGGKKVISHETRLNAVFPYFDEITQTWHNGIRTDKRKLMRLIEGLREEIETFDY